MRNSWVVACMLLLAAGFAGADLRYISVGVNGAT
jgi:hypothetical protein